MVMGENNITPTSTEVLANVGTWYFRTFIKNHLVGSVAMQYSMILKGKELKEARVKYTLWSAQDLAVI